MGGGVWFANVCVCLQRRGLADRGLKSRRAGGMCLFCIAMDMLDSGISLRGEFI
jgi:hypothetical protein